MTLATPAFWGPNNLFIPEYTGKIVGFIRDEKKFAINKYAEFVKSTKTDSDGKPIAVYFVLDPDEPVRTPARADWSWAPGTRSPEAKIILNGQFVTVIMDRRAFPYEYSGQAKKASDVPIGPLYRSTAASIAMTDKTQRVATLLETTSNWSSGAVADANTLNGGFGNWANASADENSPNAFAISKTLSGAYVRINTRTNSVVKPGDLKLVVNPNLASKMQNSGEMKAYLKGSPFAKEVEAGRNDYDEMWGLPRKYNGCEIVVEDATEVTSRRNSAMTASTARNYVKPDTTAWLLSRIGGIDGVEGSPSMSTLQLWYWRYQMAVFERSDEWHDMTEGKIVDQFKEVLAAPSAGQLIQSCM